MKHFINRAWASPEHKYRAVDKNGDLYYFDSRPYKTSYGRWLTIPTDFSIFCAGKYTGEIKWEKSRETKKEYDKRDICLLCDNIIGKGKFCPKCMKEVGIKFCKMYKKSRMKSV